MRHRRQLRGFTLVEALAGVRRLLSGVRPPRGFTLVEALVAATITVLVITGALSTFIYGLRSWQAESVKNEINIDLERAMERIRQDLRLSSVGIGLMAFYPVNASEYTAISFPMSTVTNGLLQREDSGKIKWTQTIIYHVLPGNPDQLRRTVFSPRYTNATPSQLYSQLTNVVQSNATSACLTNESVSEQVVFQNLVTLRIRPPEIQFDGYAPSYCKARTFNWGSVILSNGAHNLKFTIEGQNTNSTGYKVGFDWFSLSLSASPREGEIYLPLDGHPENPYYSYSLSGGSEAAQDMSSNGASWSGNCQLTYTGAAVSNSITFVVQNDLWCDANFDNPPGIIASNVSRKTDDSFTNSDPLIPDIVISMDKGTNWTAEGCTDSTFGDVDVPSTDPAVINIIYGGTNPAAAITMNGAWVRVKFEAGTNDSLFIDNAKITRQLSGTNSVPGTIVNLSFGSGFSSNKIDAGTSAWSEWVPNYVIDRTNNYLVQFELKTGAGVWNNARAWVNNTVPLMSYVGGVLTPTNMIIGVSALEVRYPSNGVYRSGIFDTHIADPDYKELNWTQVEPSDSDIDIRVRSGDDSSLSSATWLSYFTDNTGNPLGGLPQKRYVQYEALFSATGDHTNTAILRDITIDWKNVPTGLVDLQVDFAKGPDYGIVSATVDGQSFVKGLEIEMEIFKQGPYGTNTAVGIMEVRPLNTNK
ncbi:MAG: prepilin-type N-terminal cleavage/methylation domain-containing protein [Kiritimatiellae bacterium]|nr:prepilin-type N-terminal cleavage/methylation domain-containing protein [Kiritimatiellia bacterium]